MALVFILHCPVFAIIFKSFLFLPWLSGSNVHSNFILREAYCRFINRIFILFFIFSKYTYVSWHFPRGQFSFVYIRTYISDWHLPHLIEYSSFSSDAFKSYASSKSIRESEFMEICFSLLSYRSSNTKFFSQFRLQVQKCYIQPWRKLHDEPKTQVLRAGVKHWNKQMISNNLIQTECEYQRWKSEIFELQLVWIARTQRSHKVKTNRKKFVCSTYWRTEWLRVSRRGVSNMFFHPTHQMPIFPLRMI